MPAIGGCLELTPTPATTIVINVATDARQIHARWTAGQNETVNLTGTQKAGLSLTLCIANDGTARTITLGTGLSGKGNLVGTANQMAVLTFESNGTKFYETGRILQLSL